MIRALKNRTCWQFKKVGRTAQPHQPGGFPTCWLPAYSHTLGWDGFPFFYQLLSHVSQCGCVGPCGRSGTCSVSRLWLTPLCRCDCCHLGGNSLVSKSRQMGCLLVVDQPLTSCIRIIQFWQDFQRASHHWPTQSRCFYHKLFGVNRENL